MKRMNDVKLSDKETGAANVAVHGRGRDEVERQLYATVNSKYRASAQDVVSRPAGYEGTVPVISAAVRQGSMSIGEASQWEAWMYSTATAEEYAQWKQANDEVDKLYRRGSVGKKEDILFSNERQEP